MERGHFELTQKGANLLAYCQTGEKLAFTRLELGDGIVQDSEVFKLTKLRSPKASYPIIGVEATKNDDGTPDGKALIRADVINGNIKKAFAATEVGIYANDPREGEILYAVAINTEYPDFIAESFHEIYKMKYNIMVIIGNALNLEVTVDWSMVCASVQDIKDIYIEIDKLQEQIREIYLIILRIGNENIGVTVNNAFSIDCKYLTLEEEWGYIWDEPNGRLVF